MATSTLTLVHYSENTSIWPQVFAAAVVCLGPLASGIGKGYSSPALASLQDSHMPIVTVPHQRPAPEAESKSEPESDSDSDSAALNLTAPDALHMTDDPGKSREAPPLSVSPQEASWIASLSLLGALFGDIFAGAALSVGRRRAMTIVAIPFSISWFATVYAHHVYFIFATSFIGGFCSAILTLGSQIYISEIASPKIRGSLCSLAKITTNFGNLTCFVLGAYMDWRKLAFFAGTVPLVLFFLLRYIPESPSFLLFKGRERESMEALQWLRGDDACVLGELDAIKENLLVSSVSERCSPTPGSVTEEEAGTVLKPRGRFRSGFKILARPILITCTVMFLQRCSGAFVLNSYAVVIFQHAVASLSPHSVAIMHASVQLGASFLFAVLVDKVGRKPLLVGGNVFISAALAGLAWSLHGGAASVGLDWLPISCIVIFTVAYSVGIGPIPMLLVGELFPIEFRGVGGAVATSFSHACGFVVVKTFVDFQRALELSGTFCLYSALSLAAIVFIVLFVPETKGRTLEDIQRRLRRS